MIVDPREAIRRIPAYISEKFGVQFHWRTPATAVDTGVVHSGKQRFEADRIYVCNGPEFEQLFPELWAAAPITRCKLQMLRVVAQPSDFCLGAALCGSLSLVHYAGFEQAADLAPREQTQPGMD